MSNDVRYEVFVNDEYLNHWNDLKSAQNEAKSIGSSYIRDEEFPLIEIRKPTLVCKTVMSIKFETVPEGSL